MIDYDKLKLAHELAEKFSNQGLRVLNGGCQHESNGLTYMTNPPQNKCLKCGEFYK